jgi:hypothetical protein
VVEDPDRVAGVVVDSAVPVAEALVAEASADLVAEVILAAAAAAAVGRIQDAPESALSH